MRTTINIEIEDETFEALSDLTQARTRTEAVHLALRDYIRLKRKEELLALRDRFEIDDSWVELRTTEIDELREA